MTLYGNGNNAPVGGIMSPFQGTTPGVAGGATQQLPAGMTILEALSRGLVSRNSLVNTVNGVSVGGPTGVIGADPCSIDELLSTGNGNQANQGVSLAPVAGQIGENQQYVVGLSSNASLSNGPASENTDPIGIAPVPAGLPISSVALIAQGFSG